MCRLFGLYANKNVNVNFSFYKADKSLIKQSYENPSGWGIAWFDKKWNVCKEPRPLFQSYKAESIIKKAYGRIIISHVRMATHGGETIENTHPWLYKNWVFAHNGVIDDKKLINFIKNEFKDFEGETDSEKLFHLIIQEIHELNNPIEGIKSAIDKIKNIRFSSLNFITSNGRELYALRYTKEKEDYYTLYYTERPKEGIFLRSKDTRQLIEMKLHSGEKAIIIASECMTEEDWKLIENKHLIVIDENLNIKSISI